MVLVATFLVTLIKRSERIFSCRNKNENHEVDAIQYWYKYLPTSESVNTLAVMFMNSKRY